MMLVDGKVARNFLEVFGFWLFLLLRFVLEKCVWYKICSSDFALSNKKKLDWFRSRRDGLRQFDICAKTFAPQVIGTLATITVDVIKLSAKRNTPFRNTNTKSFVKQKFSTWKCRRTLSYCMKDSV